MNCETFRQLFSEGRETGASLAHMRECSDCLELAVAGDSDNLFRSLGGEIDPPGGVEPFVDSVMEQIRVRGTETQTVRRRSIPAPWRWGVAAALALVVTGTAWMNFAVKQEATSTPSVATAPTRPSAPLETRPVVESYEAANATIVEVDTAGHDGMQVVMIFDDTLPVDL